MTNEEQNTDVSAVLDDNTAENVSPDVIQTHEEIPANTVLSDQIVDVEPSAFDTLALQELQMFLHYQIISRLECDASDEVIADMSKQIMNHMEMTYLLLPRLGFVSGFNLPTRPSFTTPPLESI